MTFHPAEFERIHAHGADPWRMRSSWYEERKRALAAAMLPRRHYRSAFEPGCSVGELTAVLAGCSDRVEAWDVSASALASARRRLRAFGHVTLDQRAIPGEWPAGCFDLIVVSEIGYYLDRDALRLLGQCITKSLDADGDVVLCHWRRPLDRGDLDGDMVHAMLRESLLLPVVSQLTEDDFQITVLSRCGGSMGQREERG